MAHPVPAKKEDDKKIYVRCKWDRRPFPYIKTLTQSLYNSDRQLEAWGYAALHQLAQRLTQAKDKDAENCCHLLQKKMTKLFKEVS